METESGASGRTSEPGETAELRGTVSLDELTRLALEGDPDAPVPPDAVPISTVVGEPAPGLLPDWLMPPAHSGGSSPRARRRLAIVGLVVLALLAVNAVGLCVTNGTLEIAW
ncbi:MAG: hypothetical protein R2715_22395 [Ilumatobacteraceae bacterium]